MTTKTIHQGQTVTLNNSAIFGGTLEILGGLTGGYGGAAIIGIDATLASSGKIELQSAAEPTANRPAGGPAVLINYGHLVNSGTIIVHPGTKPGNFDQGAMPATLENTGVLTNTGAILLLPGPVGQNYYQQAGLGGVLDSTGMLTNTGTIEVFGGEQPSSYASLSYGGFLLSNGVLMNEGTIILDGGGGATAGAPYGGQGGNLFVYGMATNTGVIRIEATDHGVPGRLEIFGRGTLNNAGLITGADPGSSGNVTVYDTLLDTGTIDLALSSYFSVVGTLLLDGSAHVSASVINDGTISGNGSLAGAINNDGSIIATGGTLSVSGTIDSSNAVFAAAAGATLALTGSIADDITISLAAASTLQVTADAAGLAIRSPDGGTIALTGGGRSLLNPADTRLTAVLLQAGTLTLSQTGFVSAVGSSGNDTLIALAAQQTLTGGLGIDLLAGAVASGDTFRDTAAGLNGDTIADFAGTDQIDITDLAPGSDLKLTYIQGSGSGILTVSEGSTSSKIMLLGSFSSSSFSTASDGHGGVLIGLH